jgi:uncharacterized protein
MTEATASQFDVVGPIAVELQLPPRGVAAVVQLLEEGATVPFIARYRKEVTGGLDEVQIRDIQERKAYLRELEERRTAVLASIEEQGKLTPELKKRILACSTKAALEDLYAPYKQKRRTRATIAKEKGLEPLALRILAQPLDGRPLEEAQAFVSAEKEVPSAEEALKGARDIVAEVVADHADVRALLRDAFANKGEVATSVVKGKEVERTKFEDYYDYREAAKDIPSHRFLAIRRGETEGVLRLKLEVDPEPLLPRLQANMGLNPASPWADVMRDAVDDAFKRLLAPSVETDVRVDLKLRADREAVDVFAENLRHLLLAAPLGQRAVVGVDPGLRTGCKLAAVDATGRYLGTDTIYPFKGVGDVERAKSDFLRFLARYNPLAIAVGNGTAGRETETFVREVLRDPMVPSPKPLVVLVSESGASIYSASDIAREEFPDLDLTIRGAISIARRLQDPLAELVKIDPKSIGVGQYQHDVHQSLLKRKLGEVVESCVNAVGVELNTASAPLLSFVAGVGDSLAKRIVQHRELHGAFTSRKDLLKVSGLGPRAFEQAAGFLRVRGGEHPLDGSAVHPERYELVERIAQDLGVPLGELVGNEKHVTRVDVKRYVAEGVGEPTLRDILAELRRPGRDPRDEFEAPNFREDVTKLTDLQEGMVLEGVVTNVTNFGAFVDVGVKQDGLVHISELSDRFVEDAASVVKVGQRLKVTVMEVDLERGRVALSAKSEPGRRGGGGAPRERGAGGNDARGGQGRSGQGGGGGRGGQGGGGQGGGGGRGGQGGGRDAQPKQGGFSNNPFANLKL